MCFFVAFCFFFLQNYLFMNTIRFQTVCSNVRPDVWGPNCCKRLIEKNSNKCRLPIGHCYVLTNTDLPIIPFLTCKLTVALYGDVSDNIANCLASKRFVCLQCALQWASCGIVVVSLTSCKMKRQNRLINPPPQDSVDQIRFSLACSATKTGLEPKVGQQQI